ncbi:putative dsRNA-binding protein [Reticulibacter mediterranei]|uniref:putative dsRNA-binding protein n=1 Tax=Reticulibacter mediterranei TaxID=2778369 RepID=UPI001C687480|nr:putative dsRNA-binding protein [Reticulibacter mediterranei]
MQQPTRPPLSNAKGIWNQIHQRGLAQVAYTCLVAAPVHAPLFACLCSVTIAGLHVLEGIGEATTKREAQQHAAAEAQQHLSCLLPLKGT